MKTWYVYIARAKSGYLYTGIAKDVEARINKHNSGKGAKFARMHPKLKLAYQSKPMTRSQALKREIQIKSWSRVKKMKLISGHLNDII